MHHFVHTVSWDEFIRVLFKYTVIVHFSAVKGQQKIGHSIQNRFFFLFIFYFLIHFQDWILHKPDKVE